MDGITRGYYGPELLSTALAGWPEIHNIKRELIKPGTPTQNCYVERFDRAYRGEVINMYVFRNLTEVRELTDSWITEYNNELPHDSLQDLKPWEHLAKHERAENSNQWCN